MTLASERAATPARERAWLGAALALLAVHAASFDLTRIPIVSDVRFYLYFAWRVSQGAVPHLDFFDHKTQLATYLGAGLFALGERLGLDPLVTVRAGYLLLQALGGVLAFLVLARIGGGRAGFLGVLAHCSFGLLGYLPAIGCVPKLAAVLCATGAALLAQRGRWLAAGLLGATAALDWQVGALAWLGVLAGAWVAAERRGPALARVAAGGALAGGAYLALFGLQGALGAMLDQTFLGSLARSAGTQARDTLATRLGRMAQLVASDCPAQAWLVYLGLAGVPLAFLLLRRRPELRALLVPLVTFHLGLLAFSLYDFQWHADLFVLLFGVVLWQALLWHALVELVTRRARSARARRLALAGVLVAALAVTRPGPLRPALALATPLASPRATLSDQRAVAAELEQRFAGQRVAFLESSELLLLTRRVNPLVTVFWNEASWSHFRHEDEDKDATLQRLLAAAEVAAYATPRPLALPGEEPHLERLVAPSGEYFAILQVRPPR